MIGIYAIVNRVSGRAYVGQSIDLHKRWKRHLSDALTKKKTALLDAIRSYGVESFEFVILEECERSDLCSREDFWIGEKDSFHNGYNLISTSGKGVRYLSETTRRRFVASQLGKTITPEHRAAIGRSLKGRKLSETARANMSLARKGRKFSPEHCAALSLAKSNPTDAARLNISEGQKNRAPFSDEARLNMSMASRGKQKSPEHRAKIAAALRGNRNRANSMDNNLMAHLALPNTQPTRSKVKQ